MKNCFLAVSPKRGKEQKLNERLSKLRQLRILDDPTFEETEDRYIFFKSHEQQVKYWKAATSLEDGGHLLRIGLPATDRTHKELRSELLRGKPSSADGLYVIALIDKDVIVKTDPLGVFPVYVAEGRLGCAVSNRPELAASCAGHQIEFDPLLFMEKVITDGNLQGSEVIRHVGRVPPNGMIVLSENAQYRMLRNEINYDYVPTKEEMLDHFCDNILKMAAFTDEPLVCRLTGGYDSRLVLGVLLRSGANFICSTAHYPDPDAHTAVLVTDKLSSIYPKIDHLLNTRLTSSVYLSGGCGETNKAFYYYKGKDLESKKALDNLEQHYFNVFKQHACPNSEKKDFIWARAVDEFRRCRKQAGDPYLGLDLFYCNRIRSWYSWNINKADNVTSAPLIDPLYLEFRKNYSAQERAQFKGVTDLMLACDPALLSVPFLKKKATLASKIMTSVSVGTRQDIVDSRARLAVHNPLPRICPESLLRRHFKTGSSLKRHLYYTNTQELAQLLELERMAGRINSSVR